MPKPKKYKSDKTKSCGRKRMEDIDKKEKVQLYFVARDIQEKGGHEVVAEKLKAAFYDLKAVSK